MQDLLLPEKKENPGFRGIKLCGQRAPSAPHFVCKVYEDRLASCKFSVILYYSTAEGALPQRAALEWLPKDFAHVSSLGDTQATEATAMDLKAVFCRSAL